jgi:hypothetical protein
MFRFNERHRGESWRSRRFIPLLDQMLALLDFYVASRELAPDDLLFGNANGTLKRDNNFRRRVWEPLAKSIGCFGKRLDSTKVGAEMLYESSYW